uniref:Uncharacterized protein n=1 Tax=Zea mays TaxID=4577 RepID=A0A804MD05_MAIZE
MAPPALSSSLAAKSSHGRVPWEHADALLSSMAGAQAPLLPMAPPPCSFPSASAPLPGPTSASTRYMPMARMEHLGVLPPFPPAGSSLTQPECRHHLHIFPPYITASSEPLPLFP